MSTPSRPRTMSAAMITMKNWRTLVASASSVSIRFLSSTALSSWAVPSVASRSMSALTIPWTNSRAARRAMSATRTMSSDGRTSSTKNAEMVLHGFVSKSGIAAQPSVPGGHQDRPWRAGSGRRVDRGRSLRGRAPEPDRDGGGGLARLGRELRDATRRDPESRPPDVDRGDDVAARIVDRGGHRVEVQLVFADRHRVAPPTDAGQLLEQRLELDDRPLGVADEAAPDDAQHLAFGQR